MPLISETSKVNEIPADAPGLRIQHGNFEWSVYIDGTYDHKIGHYNGKEIGPTVNATWHTHVGLCIEEFERNGYHDSDFYMRVWNEEKQCVEAICFASTRYGCGSAFGARADATPETLAKAKAWYAARDARIRAERRQKQAAELRALRAEVRKVAAANGVNAVRFQKLRKVYGDAAFRSLVSLFGSRIRNNFKLKLKAQVIAWLQEDAPKYATPLSSKQMQYV
jgi:hypothetical protein